MGLVLLTWQLYDFCPRERGLRLAGRDADPDTLPRAGAYYLRQALVGPDDPQAVVPVLPRRAGWSSSDSSDRHAPTLTHKRREP